MAEPSSRSVYPCSACGMHTARHLDEVSRDALVNFFECTSCHHLPRDCYGDRSGCGGPKLMAMILPPSR
jgi:hypothetical protein